MIVVVCTSTGTSRITLTANDLDKIKNCKTDDDAAKTIRNNINTLFCADIKPFFFTPNMIATVEILMEHDIQDDRMTELMLLMNQHMNVDLNKHLHNALVVLFDSLPDICNIVQKSEIVSQIQSSVYPRCNIRSMCFVHQILQRVQQLQSGEILLESNTLIDKICDQLRKHICLFSYLVREGNFPSETLQIFIQEVYNQILIYYKVRVQDPNTDPDGECGSK